MGGVIEWLDAVTIVAAAADLGLTAWIWFKVDDVEEDLEDALEEMHEGR